MLIQRPDEHLHLVFCDVGQGDAILLFKNDQQILIDGGPSKQVLSCLGQYMPFWDRELELMVLTHPDNDHVAGLISVLANYQVAQFVGPGVGKSSAAFTEFVRQLEQEQTKIFVAKKGDHLRLAGIELTVLWPESGQGSDLAYQPGEGRVLGASDSVNETSVVLRVDFGEFDVLLPGDIGFKSEQQLVGEELSGIEVFKVSHHGSKYSSGEEFLASVKPALAVISVGKNSFGHPTDEVLSRLQAIGTRILRTDIDGSIEVISNGQSWWLAD